MRRRAEGARGPALGLSARIWSSVFTKAIPALALVGSLGGVACAPIPKPAVLAEVEQVRGGPAAKEARALAPGSVAHAEKLGREANAAFEAGDTAGAQILAERALAAYAHASAVARIARAEASGRGSAEQESKARAELTGIEADQARVLAEAEALEARLKVAVDAQPVVPSGAADPEREKARVAAARALSLQARLLCSAGRLLLERAPLSVAAAASPSPPAATPAPSAPAASSTAAAPSKPAAPPAPAAASSPPSSPAAPAAQTPATAATRLEEATAALTKLDADLAAGGPAPIDQASRARAGCLAALTSIRRAATPVAKAPGSGDALLTALSAVGTWSPSRDDHGVSVTLRGLFKGDALTPAGSARLAELGRIAAAHPTFPVVVVLHQDKEPAKKDAKAERAQASRAELIVKALKAERAPRVESVLAGAALPVVSPEGADRARNARVEVVFVTPETF